MIFSTLINTTEKHLIANIELNTAKEWLCEYLHGSRLEHSLGAYDKALALGKKFNLSPEEIEKACTASLLHDCAKLMTPEDLKAYCQNHNIALSDYEKNAPQTIHPFVGAHMVQEKFDLSDDDVLNAIRYHTTGRSGMSLVEKVVYIADKIEENTRNPLFVKKVEAHLNPSDPASIDKTMLFLMDSTISFLLEKKQVIHPRTLAARNDYVIQVKKEDSSID